jgi:hypothetical protein
MTVSTNGEICYGIVFEDGFAFPWDDGIEDWWLETIHNFRPSVQLFDASGNYIKGVEPSKEAIDAYFQEKRDFEKAHPLPVELINYCSGDYPMWIVALPDVGLRAKRGYPTSFNPAELVVTDEQRKTLLDFCKAHKIDIGDEQPKWWLSSYWG